MAKRSLLADLWKPALVVLIGAVLIGYGFGIDPTEPDCNSAPLAPGQICEVTVKGATVRQGYDDLVAQGRTRRLGFPIGGGVVVLAGLEPSNGAARKLIQNRGLKVHGEPYVDPQGQVQRTDLEKEGGLVLQKGKDKFARLVLGG